jgi:hypothetical protein
MATKAKTTKKKAAVKKMVAKQKAKRADSVKHEIVLHVDATPQRPTEDALSEPIRDGKSLSIPKTWLSEKQITRLVEKTPSQYVYERPGKGGGKWSYVTVSYVQRVLDYAFGFNWDFEIVEHGKEHDHVWVLGKLTVYSENGDRHISKSQFGRSEVKYKKDSKDMLDYGNDLKAASSDALKKCASMLGIARDIYGKTDYKQESGHAPIPPQAPQPAAQSHPEEPSIQQGGSTPQFEDHVCQSLTKGGCGRDLTKQEAAYSKRLYGRELCKEHYPKR